MSLVHSNIFCAAWELKSWYEMLIEGIGDLVDTTKEEHLLVLDDHFNQNRIFSKLRQRNAVFPGALTCTIMPCE